MLRGIAVFRSAQWAWLATLMFLHRVDLAHAALAWGVVALMLIVTAALGTAAIVDPDRAMMPSALAAEGIIAVVVQFIGGYVYIDDPFSSTHVVGAAWPIAFVLTIAVVAGWRWGTIAGVGIGLARLLQPVTAGMSLHRLESGQWPPLLSSILLYVLAGAVAGYVVQLLVRAEREVAEARARNQVASMLHDGVLQTLAAIERRADDPALAQLAREQERELREFLFGPSNPRDRAHDAGVLLRASAAKCEDSYGVRCEVVLAPDFPTLPPTTLDALVGAVTEALTNAGKYARASRVIVYGEPNADGEGIFVSVRDDGRGFDLASAALGQGLTGSIQNRIAAEHGRVEIETGIGQGTEVQLWLPT